MYNCVITLVCVAHLFVRNECLPIIHHIHLCIPIKKIFTTLYNNVKVVEKQSVYRKRVYTYTTYLVQGNIWYRQKLHVNGVGANTQKDSLYPNDSCCRTEENLSLDIFYQQYYIFGKLQWILKKKCNIYYSTMFMNSLQAYLCARTHRPTSVEQQHNGN